MSAPINFKDLRTPSAIEDVNFDQRLADLRARLVALFPAIATSLDSEADINSKLLELLAELRTQFDARINDSVKALLLPFAVGSDLEHIGTTYHRTSRKDNEDDEQYRRRIALAPDAKSVAGPVNAYLFHALSASPDVKAAAFESPTPNHVNIFILSHANSGKPSAALLDIVRQALNPDDVRPQGDKVNVQSAFIQPYQIKEKLVSAAGFNVEKIYSVALGSIQQYVHSQHILGGVISESGLHGALHVNGVEEVRLEPASFTRLEAAANQALYCDDINLQVVREP